MSALSNAPRAFRTRSTFGLACLMLILAGCGGDGDGKKDEAKPESTEEKGIVVEVAPVSRATIAASYNGTATLEATAQAQVVAKASGVLLSVLTEEGQPVQVGQVIARLDPDQPRLEVARNEAMLRKLEAEFARSTELFERKLVAADAHERIRYDLETQRAAWEMAKLQLSYTEIRAPISGVVARRMVKQGNLIKINDALFDIVDVARLEAVLNVPERELRNMAAGQPVQLRVDAAPGTGFDGVIDRVSPVVDPASGTFRVVCAFSDATGVLKPGMFGRIDVSFDERANALTVPREALIEGEGDVAVFMVKDGLAVRTPIQPGHVNAKLVEVLAGISEGERVVTKGKVSLRDGSRISVLGETSETATVEAAAATTATN
ncbi:MAG TPA: efflux RND transporter periplasmic adaptor subunit [Aquimonas sp.]|nr:efflux RND transporter periplasmic adaptor subunit [Aquimonas sp.]